MCLRIFPGISPGIPIGVLSRALRSILLKISFGFVSGVLPVFPKKILLEIRDLSWYSPFSITPEVPFNDFCNDFLRIFHSLFPRFHHLFTGFPKGLLQLSLHWFLHCFFFRFLLGILPKAHSRSLLLISTGISWCFTAYFLYYFRNSSRDSLGNFFRGSSWGFQRFFPRFFLNFSNISDKNSFRDFFLQNFLPEYLHWFLSRFFMDFFWQLSRNCFSDFFVISSLALPGISQETLGSWLLRGFFGDSVVFFLELIWRVLPAFLHLVPPHPIVIPSGMSSEKSLGIYSMIFFSIT